MIHTRLPADLLARLDSLVGEGSRSDYVRQLLEAGIGRREEEREKLEDQARGARFASCEERDRLYSAVPLDRIIDWDGTKVHILALLGGE